MYEVQTKVHCAGAHVVISLVAGLLLLEPTAPVAKVINRCADEPSVQFNCELISGVRASAPAVIAQD